MTEYNCIQMESASFLGPESKIKLREGESTTTKTLSLDEDFVEYTSPKETDLTSHFKRSYMLV